MPEWNGEQKDNDGAAFAVEQPKKEDWHDDWSGRVMVDGSEYWIGIRDMTSAAGKPYKKVRFNPITENYTARAREGEQASADDIPF